MLKAIAICASVVVFILSMSCSFAIAPGAAEAQVQNNRQEMQKNQERTRQMQQMRHNKMLYQQKQTPQKNQSTQ